MTPKEKIGVGIFAFVLTNLSIVLTLYFAGHFGSKSSNEPPPLSEDELAAIDANHAAIAAKYAPEEYKLQPSRLTHVHSLSEAMYICAEKLQNTKPGVAKSFEFDYVASKYNEDTDIYHVFADLEIASRAGKGYEQSDVNCDVDAADRKIINFKVSAK
ncbi:hypothetical protein R50073_36300 [Maricurvus nonylphenolicus]|uniref:hypothetical protein n=1 Tax=Maricurvus nonylphenolicus TaxID=1008307 RepID=UPI0036F29B8A